MATVTRDEVLDCLVPKELEQQKLGAPWVALLARLQASPVVMTPTFALQLYELFGGHPQTWTRIKALPGYPENLGA